MLQKKYRLPASQFPKVYNKGFKSRGEYGMLVASPYDKETPLFGYVVSKKVGNAVQRHKMTRRLREISREIIKKHSPTSLQFQYILFKYTDDFKSLGIEFEKQVLSQIQKWSKV